MTCSALQSNLIQGCDHVFALQSRAHCDGQTGPIAIVPEFSNDIAIIDARTQYVAGELRGRAKTPESNFR